MDFVDVTDTPVGQRVEFANTAFIKSTFTRTSQAEGHIEARDPLTGRVVLKTIMNMNTGQEVPNWFDPTFWTIYVDGKPHTGPGSNARTMRWDPNSKSIYFTT